MHSFFNHERTIVMTTTLTMRIDEALKSEAEEVFEDIGLNLSSAITCFLKKCVSMGGMPFQLVRQRKTPHELTLEAFEEAKRIAHDPNAPCCTDPDKIEEFMLS